MPKYLVKQGKTYYARLAIPEEARKILGQREFKKSLKTANYRQALAKSGAWIDLWQQQIEAARAGKRQEVEAIQLKQALLGSRLNQIQNAMRVANATTDRKFLASLS